MLNVTKKQQPLQLPFRLTKFLDCKCDLGNQAETFQFSAMLTDTNLETLILDIFEPLK